MNTSKIITTADTKPSRKDKTLLYLCEMNENYRIILFAVTIN